MYMYIYMFRMGWIDLSSDSRRTRRRKRKRVDLANSTPVRWRRLRRLIYPATPLVPTWNPCTFERFEFNSVGRACSFNGPPLKGGRNSTLASFLPDSAAVLRPFYRVFRRAAGVCSTKIRVSASSRPRLEWRL